jgi:hypothetical protein
VLLGNGDGTFQTAVNYDSPNGTPFVFISDLDADGHPDLIILGAASDSVIVLKGNGDGSFQAAVRYNVGTYAFSLTVGDVNGDGKPDLVLGCWDLVMSVLLGNGDGTFQPALLSPMRTASATTSIALADLNGDGKPDVVLTNEYEGVEEVMLGNGDGTFQSYARYGSGLNNPQSMAIADLNGDGRPDLIVGHSCQRCTAPGLNLDVLLNRYKAATSIQVASSHNPSLVNQSVTFTATVSSDSSVPDGTTIAFSDGKGPLGTGTTKNGVATLTTSFSTAKTYTVRASYARDAFHGKSSGVVHQVVQAP